MEHLCEKIALLEGPLIPRELGMDLWRARTVDETVYAQDLCAMRGLIEVWSGLGVTADEHADAMLWTSRRLPEDYRTA